jgi:hypothetical protein
LPAANFGYGLAQGFLLPTDSLIVTIAKAIDGPLDGAQGFLAAHDRFGPNDLIAQIADALGQSGEGRLWLRLFNLGVTAFHLIEQGNKLATQGLPLAGLRIAGQIGVIVDGLGAGHELTCHKRDGTSVIQHEGLSATLGKTW